MTKRPQAEELPDIWQLTGDATDPFAYSDAPNPDDVREAEAELIRRIEAAPAGALSGGVFVRSEWEQGPLHDDLYGRAEETRSGLNDEEKQLLYEAGMREVNQLSRHDFDALRQHQARQDKVVGDLWTRFQERYPREAANPEAVKAAAIAVAERLRGEGEAVSDYTHGEKADHFLDETAYAVRSGQGGGRAPLTSDDGRTAGMMGGHAAGGGGGGADRDEGPGSLVAELGDVQSKLGLW